MPLAVRLLTQYYTEILFCRRQPKGEQQDAIVP
jgi:hypothetical protein